MNPRYVLSEVGNGLRRNLSMAVSVVLVTMVSVFLLGLGLLAQKQADTMKGYWYDRIQVSVFLCTAMSQQPRCGGQGVTDAQRQTLEGQLRAMPEVKDVFYESEQEALDRFREQFRNSSIRDLLRVGDLPSSFRVQLKDPTKFTVVTEEFATAPGVALVQDQESLLKDLFRIIDGIKWFAAALAIGMGACAALLMATTIRQAAFSRRREIGIMRLVGASNWTIRMPFLLEIVLVGLLGGVLATGLLWGFIDVVFNRGLNTMPALQQAFIGTSDLWAVAPWLLGGVVLLSVVTGMATTFRALRV